MCRQLQCEFSYLSEGISPNHHLQHYYHFRRCVWMWNGEGQSSVVATSWSERKKTLNSLTSYVSYIYLISGEHFGSMVFSRLLESKRKNKSNNLNNIRVEWEGKKSILICDTFKVSKYKRNILQTIKSFRLRLLG